MLSFLQRELELGVMGVTRSEIQALQPTQKTAFHPPPPKRQTYKKSLFGEKEVWLLNWHRSGSRRADLPEEDVL